MIAAMSNRESVDWKKEVKQLFSLNGLAVNAEVEKSFAKFAQAAFQAGKAEVAVEAALIMAEAREMLGVFEDRGGHDGLGGKAYLAVLNHIDEFAARARAIKDGK